MGVDPDRAAGGEPEVVVDRDQRGRAAADRIEQRDQLRHRRHLHSPRRVEAESAADCDAQDDDDPGDPGDRDAARLPHEDEDRRRGDRDRHPAGREQVAVAGGGRRVHPAEADNEADRADEPGDPDEDLDDLERGHDAAAVSSVAGLGAVGFFRNIWSIRSVTT